MTVNITTNNHARRVIDWFELSDKEREEFDWLEAPEESGEVFVRYRQQVYAVSEFMRIGDAFPTWVGYRADSAFSGTLIRFANDPDYVVMGSYVQ